ncbi:replication-associated recombination protein A [uncultured Pseudokineococcus sp.]|uniref:replication-associated recombination protein A n=1 Tax=uncultured Pseudokineococcus sp. TaxID=1642928 RepID=UPI00263116F5|nr:replication-associated recombination protein A [uncultured Pseudokineococcus sp.]
MSGPDLFSDDDAVPAAPGRPSAEGARPPLAVRMRPRTLDEVVGQQHLLRVGSPLRRLVESLSAAGGADARPADGAPRRVTRAAPTSVVLWGPPGTGKTTLAHVVSRASGGDFEELSAITAGVKDVRRVMDVARERRDLHRRRTVLFLDEIHRFTKAQQDALLPGVENGVVVLVAATTENPSFSVISPLLSRSLLLTLQPLEPADVRGLLERALADERGLGGEVAVEDDALEHLVRVAEGDARRALTALEAAAGAAAADAWEAGLADDEPVPLRLEHAERALEAAVLRYDRDGDQHYDVISAFIKSMRGSDVDAALHYLARMLEAGEDPRFIARRIVVAASEDVGMADPTALQTAVAAAQAVQLLGMPEARITLAQAVVHLATAPKSNAAYLGVDAAVADVRAGRAGVVPPHLRDGHYAGSARLGHGVGYVYAHDAPHGVAPQQHLPDALVGRRYYAPTDRGAEREIGARLERLRAVLEGRARP